MDTHALIWYIEADNALSTKTLLLIDEPNNNVFVSIASFYEIAIKLKIDKLKLKQSLNEYFKDAVSHNISVLPISETHLATYNDVPLYAYHKDPFDRLLIATAMVEKLTIVTADKKFNLYKKFVNIVW
ncbi:MAG: type II toxin-antitoxin system VapC family toxin [Flavobacterium sp.]|nr:type II toxin-antitoxin system VapC family toxin [Flavobacterium sp.]